MNPRPLEKIDALTDEQLQQLADWLLTETLDKARELAEHQFGAEGRSSAPLVSAPQCQIENAQCSMLNEKTSSVPSAPSGEDSSVVKMDSLEQRVNASPSLSSLSPLPSVQSLSENPHSAIRIPQSLEDRVSQYTLARHHEAAHGKNPLIVEWFQA